MFKSRVTGTGQHASLPATHTGTKDDKATLDNQTRRSAAPSQFSPLLARRGSSSSISSEGSSSGDTEASGDESDVGSPASFRHASFSTSDSRARSPTGRYFESHTSLSDFVSEDFEKRHLAASDEEAKTNARQRLTGNSRLTNSTVVVLSSEDRNTLRDELKFRNETGHFKTWPSGKIDGVDHRLVATDHNPPSKPGKPVKEGPVENLTYRTNHPYRFYNMKKGDSEPVEDSGHLLYNVTENGHTRVASHLTGIDPVNLDENGKATPKPGYEQYTTTLKRMDDKKQADG
ncbi:hypothetical protein [Paraburkholderia sp. XV]|uniref:hypothetical protein n=1 Tax=Paraburkholderia sp. XV TaxID=2831520 RepID=UPI001CD40307|nr:hypothetical protein [Paraburkholderia sp. XV]